MYCILSYRIRFILKQSLFFFYFFSIDGIEYASDVTFAALASRETLKPVKHNYAWLAVPSRELYNQQLETKLAM